MNITVYTDGGSLNNPGEAASAYLIYNNGVLIEKGAVALGIASNNVAEYMALVLALEKVRDLLKNNRPVSIICYADSKLMVSQLRGIYKIKHPDMKRLAARIKLLEEEIGTVPLYQHIPREENAEADALVKSILDP